MTGGSTLGIGVTMFLRDQFSGPAAKIRASGKQLEEDFLRMQEAQLRHQRNIAMGVAFAGAMALRGMGRMVKKAAEFGYEMEFVKSITDATYDEQKRLTDIAKRLGRETMFYPQAIAEGMRFMAMAGMSAKEVEQNIQGAVALAGATKAELGGKGGAADVMTNIMKQFRVGFEYTNEVADVLAYAVTRANTNLFDLGEALKYAGSTAMDLNVTLNESTAMVMALGNAGIQGSMAGVAMENSMRYLSRAFSSFASGPSRRALAEIGMSVEDVTDQEGNLLTMTEVIKKIGNAVDQNFGKGMNLEKQAILQSIFGVRGKRAGSLLIRNLQEFETFSAAVSEKSAGHSAKIMTDMMSTLQGYLYKFGSAWQAMWVSFTEKVAPTLTWVLRNLVRVMGFMERLFDKRIIGGFLAHAIAGFLVWTTVMAATKSVMAGISLIKIQLIRQGVTMGTTNVSAFNASTAAALKYSAALSTVRTSQMASMVGAGMIPGLALNRAGRIVNQKTHQFVSSAGAASLAAGTGKMVGGKVVTRTAGSLMMGKLAAFFGGPKGLILAFVLPGLIGAAVDAIKGSKESTEKNTKAMEDAQRAQIREETQYSRVGHMIKLGDLVAPRVTALGITGPSMGRDLEIDAMYRIVKKLEELSDVSYSQPINIYIDNEKNVETVLERKHKDALNLFQ